LRVNIHQHQQGQHRLRNALFIAAGSVVVIATYLYLIVAEPADVGTSMGSGSLIAMAGYVIGAVLISIGTLQQLPTNTIVMIPVAIALNIVVGQITKLLSLPVYLDSIGTILVAVLAGAAAGAATGAITNVIWGLTFNPLALPFAIAAIVIGALAGLAARLGVFRTYWAPPLAGVVVGTVSAFVSAPIAAFVFGGATGGGPAAIVGALQAMGNSLLASATVQSLLSDPLDKAITFTVVMLILAALPSRVTQRFPFVRNNRVLPRRKSAAPSTLVPTAGA
jgi:energy-coupling factor transport system substrate-specific component